MKNYEAIKTYLLENINEIDCLVSEINSYDGSLEYLQYYDNDEEFFNTFFYNNPTEAVRASFYGNYNYCDPYVMFDGYGNLKSISEYDLEDEYKFYIDHIINSVLDHYDKICICDDKLEKLIKSEAE